VTFVGSAGLAETLEHH